MPKERCERERDVRERERERGGGVKSDLGT